MRKLEYLVVDALAQAATHSSRSAACSRTTRGRSPPLQLAAAAARTGLKCVLVQESWVE
jgi:1-aminocyclopropane-1-carboxylate deaminase